MIAEVEQAILSLKNVGLDYDAFLTLGKRLKYAALDDVSFNVYQGERLAVIGNNGSGKSSLLRIMAGIINPHRGLVSRRPNLRSSLLSLGYGFRADLTGRENVILSAMLQGHSKRAVLESLAEVEERAGVREFFDRPLRTYSTGMRARLSFACAQFNKAELILVDEITAVTDLLFDEDANVHSEKPSRTFVFVSHKAGKWQKFCTRAIWLDQGRVVMDGEYARVKEAYQNSQID